jgi:Sulfotransferase family
MFERILHSAEGISSLGEFHCLWRLNSCEITCSCGNEFEQDKNWSVILSTARVGNAELARLNRLESLVCRTGYIVKHGLSLERLARQAEVREFLDLQFHIFSAVAKHTKSKVLVDSSKAGPRAWIMACDPRVKIVHLYRDPADVLVSWRSAKFDRGLGSNMMRMPVREAAIDWWKVEQLARVLGARRTVFRISYEALCCNPRRQIDSLWQKLGLPASAVPAWIGDNRFAQGSDYHSLNGNPDRFETGPISISARKANWQSVSAADGVAIRAIATPLRLAYPPLATNLS